MMSISWLPPKDYELDEALHQLPDCPAREIVHRALMALADNANAVKVPAHIRPRPDA